MDRHNQPQRWPLDHLKDHPRQASIFADISEEELAALAADMEKNGLRTPVEILSDGTVITGHQRVRAARLLGWREIDVVVRTDLEAAGPAAVEAHFINDNLVRRHLSPLARARCVRRLMEIETNCRNGRLPPKEALKLRIGQLLHMSARSVNRYLLALETPLVVQQAFDQGQIKLTDAGRVALLPRRNQEVIANRIVAGEDAAQVVAEFLSGDNAGVDEVGRSFTRLVSALKREVPRLATRVGEIKPRRLVRCQDVLRSTVDVLAVMLARASQEAS